MSKIEFNTEEQEITITRRIGRSGESTVTVSPEEAGIQINLGIASIGATTDFGGAISLGIAGQEITWGREGGTIHIGIGGFAVDVEARDCIVTEIKSIFGIIVAQRSYPDPGCKLPTPTPIPTPPPIPTPTPNEGINIPNDSEMYWAIFGEITGYKNLNGVVTYNPDSNPLITDISTPNFTDSLQWIAYYPVPFSVERVGDYSQRYRVRRGSQGNYNSYSIGNAYFPESYKVILALFSSEIYEETTNSWRNYYYSPIPLAFLATGQKLNEFFTEVKKRHTEKINTGYLGRVGYFVPKLLIPIKPRKADKPFLPTGNKPPMKDCCEEVLDMLEDIKEAFAVDRLLKDKFPVSNTFMAPGCDPESVTQAKNYYEIFQCVMRMMAHGMIFEPRVNIKDADAAKAGDQEFKAKYLNATGWASAVAEALLEVKDDGNVSTNMDIRNGFAVTQTMVGLADAIYRLNAILDSIGVELIPITETVDTPYNLQIQIGKGFGEGNERQIDLNTDEATEKLLPTFLQVKKNKIKTVDIHPRSRSIKEILESIESHLPSSNNG